MKRRTFICLLGRAAVVWPFAVRAQARDGIAHVAILMPVAANDVEAQRRVTILTEELRKLGWELGRNLAIDVRWAAGDAKLMQSYATELVALKPNVILVQSNEALAHVREQTNDIPIVVAVVSDPVGSGFVRSLARPGGNITGFSNQEPAMAAKWLQLLKQIAPSVQRAALLFNPSISANVAFVSVAEAAAGAVGLRVQPVPVRDAVEVDTAIGTFALQPNGGLVVFPNPLVQVQRELLIALASRHAMPAVYPYRFMATAGGLLAYGVDFGDLFRRSAAYIHRILNGERPGDLPVQLPTKFEMVINLKTAKALGLEVPQSLLATADEVIE